MVTDTSDSGMVERTVVTKHDPDGRIREFERFKVPISQARPAAQIADLKQQLSTQMDTITKEIAGRTKIPAGSRNTAALAAEREKKLAGSIAKGFAPVIRRLITDAVQPVADRLIAAEIRILEVETLLLLQEKKPVRSRGAKR